MKDLRPKIELGVISIGHGFTHWYTSAFFLILPFLSQDFGLSFTQAGLLVTFRTAIAALANFPSGAISDLLGTRRLMMAFSLIWLVATYGAIGWSTNYVLLQVFVALVGIGNVSWHAPAMTTLSERFPTRRGFALSIHEFGANLGEGLVPIGVGMLLVVMSWRDALHVQILPGLLMAAVVWIVSVDPVRKTARKGASGGIRAYGRQVRNSVANPTILLLASIGSLRTMSQQVLNTFLPLYLVVGLGMAANVAGGYVAALTLPSLLSGLVVGTISDRLGRRLLMLIGLAASSVLLAVLAFAGSGPFFVAALVGLGLFLFSIRPVVMANAMDTVPPEVGGATIAFLFLTNSTLSAISPFFAGMMADQVGLLSTFYLASGFMLLAVVAAWLLPPTARRPAPAESVAVGGQPAGVR